MTKKWQKILYDKQGVPDNYVDPTFLSDLKKNVNLRKYSMSEAVIGVLPVTHEICCTVLFVLTFIFLKEEISSIFGTVGGVLLLLLVSNLLHLPFANISTIKLGQLKFMDFTKSCVIFLGFGYIFSPILKDLTKTVSTDTIYAMTSLMLIVHVFFQDYGAEAAIVSSSLSVNSALFAAVCLSSRLPTVFHTFALVILAVKIFVLLPLFRRAFKESNISMFLNTVMLFITDLVILVYLSLFYAILFTVLCFVINILCPSLFVYCQKYKDNIFGPWDEAIVRQEQKAKKNHDPLSEELVS
ncbi:phosphatidylinositol N-acetylglucosaminyltransferase subunit C-like [Uloborus diversus]|uniref:phosphatidylinositol N-acetylglucosaminyltransferase subunit C-like n=1 Tax=Uloborus diversus TaxID=327109 RepID=UPI002409EEE2|nr:phosphatidylinositol N-acetylglucosaminyltransferase subunit C-like [Uloborus diversus]